jgi:hypothetical protein
MFGVFSGLFHAFRVFNPLAHPFFHALIRSCIRFFVRLSARGACSVPVWCLFGAYPVPVWCIEKSISRCDALF